MVAATAGVAGTQRGEPSPPCARRFSSTPTPVGAAPSCAAPMPLDQNGTRRVRRILEARPFDACRPSAILSALRSLLYRFARFPYSAWHHAYPLHDPVLRRAGATAIAIFGSPERCSSICRAPAVHGPSSAFAPPLADSQEDTTPTESRVRLQGRMSAVGAGGLYEPTGAAGSGF